EQRTVTVEPGTTVRVAVVLAPSSAPGAEVAPAPVRRDAVVHPPPPRASRVPAYLALGTAGVLATTGVVAWRVRENLVAIYNDNSRCRVGALTRAEQCAGWSQGADVALGVEVGAFVGAGIAAALGGWALLRAPGRAPSATFWCAPWTGAGVTCARTF
ncbi:MAG TPA: hypothetical protein VKU41_17745, partial [Polyangiaceae bacterium]|nr:hypothetical protein [Polyangiaceae bacterium]